MSYKIAIASTDGKVVNQHFGRANKFHIVLIQEDDLTLTYLESRKVSPICNGQEHDEEKLEQVAETLKDCQYVLVSKIGDGARNVLNHYGVEVYEVPGFIEEGIKRVQSLTLIKDLYDNF